MDVKPCEKKGCETMAMSASPSFSASGHCSEERSISRKSILGKHSFILDMYELIRRGRTFGEIRRVADKKVSQNLKDVI